MRIHKKIFPKSLEDSNLRFATKEDFEEFYIDEKIPHSAKAWILEKDNKKVAIGGIWLIPMQFTAFVRIKDNLPKKEFWKVSKLVTEELRNLNTIITSIRDDTQSNSKKYLEKLGYEYFNTVNNQEIYKLWPK